MAQCEGTSQRTGARCKRSAAAGATTCYYHGPEATQARQAREGAESTSPVRVSGRRAFTTKLLSERTWDDFETLFAAGTGWGRCGCLFALDASRSTRGGTWAQQRRANLDTMRGLVGEGRSEGILVYDAGAPIGWCQFVPKDHLRFTDTAASGADWFITCFVVHPNRRGLGASGVALRAALDAIQRRGGGLVQGHATAIAPGPAPRSARKDLHVDDDVLFAGGNAKVRYGVEVEGVGPVAALYRGRRSMHNAALGGTVDLYRRAGFDAVEVLPRPKAALADRIAMRRTM